MLSLPTLLKPQSPNFLSLFPISPLSLSTSQTLTLKFSTKTPFISHASLSSTNYQLQHLQDDDQEGDDDDEEEHVIGDCLVFEDGVFEDPYLQQDFNYDSKTDTPKKTRTEIEPESLVPDNWKEVQADINITKKERRKIAQQLEWGSRVEKKKVGLIPLRNVNVESYLSYRSDKLSQLKPLVLDNPSDYQANVEVTNDKNVEVTSSSSGRVAPRNPRMAAYGRTLEDISELFNSGSYEPGDIANKSDGPRKLFNKEEKFLLNRQIPNLAAATSAKWLPLHTLAASGQFYLLDALLKHNVDINGADKDGLTALHKAIICKKQAITNYLLRESANPFVCDKDGATLMHYAVRSASTQMIKILLLYNVDINLQDNDGWTPLHLAVQTRRTDLVRLLLIKGADKTLKNKDGLTPLELCLYSGQDTRTYELIKLMKQYPKSRQ